MSASPNSPEWMNARYAILAAIDADPPLWELLGGLTVVVGKEIRPIDPPMTVEDLRPALEDLLLEGHIRLYDFRSDGDEYLALEDALRVVADDRSWLPPTETDQPETWAAGTTTESGEVEYRSVSFAVRACQRRACASNGRAEGDGRLAACRAYSRA